jgi:hypothetical protein
MLNRSPCIVNCFRWESERSAGGDCAWGATGAFVMIMVVVEEEEEVVVVVVVVVLLPLLLVLVLLLSSQL